MEKARSEYILPIGIKRRRKIRRAIGEGFKQDMGVSIGVGVAGVRDNMKAPDDLVREGDSAHYAANAVGKNRVVEANGAAEASHSRDES